MKIAINRLLVALVGLVAICANLEAANPSFSSFDPEQFTTNNLRIRINTNALANVTTVLSNSIVIITNTTFIINGNTNDLTQLWTNKTGIYEPTETNATTIAIGRSVDTWWVPSTADGFVNIHDQAQGESQFNTIALAAIDDAASTTNYALFTVNVAGGDLVSGQLRGVALTNWQDPNAPVSKFMVRLEPRFGEAEMILLNNGETNFWITNNVTSVEAMRWIPHTNDVLLAGPQNIDVAHYSHVALSATNTDPSLTDILLSAPIFDGTFLLLRNITDGQGFTLLNGSPLYDTPTAHVTLQGGTWVTTNAGDGLLLTGSPEGWSEVFRWTQNTNVQTSQLWELVSGHMRTVPETVDDWQFRYGGVPQLTVGTNGTLLPGVASPAYYGSSPGLALGFFNDTDTGGTGQWEITAGGGSAAGADQSNVDIGGDNHSAAVSANSSSLAGEFYATQITSNTNFNENVGLTINWNSTNLTRLAPFIPDGSLQNAAYQFDTALPLSVTKLVAFRNNQTNQLAFGPLAEIWFGEGGTNVLFRRDDSLVVSNSVVGKLWVSNGAGNEGGIYVGSDIPRFAPNGSSQGVELADNANRYVRWVANIFAPLQTGTDLGSNGAGGLNPWHSLSLQGITKAQKTALSPADGMIVYQTDNTPGFRGYVNGAWVMFSTVADP